MGQPTEIYHYSNKLRTQIEYHNPQERSDVPNANKRILSQN